MIKLFNSLSKKKEEFKPVKKGEVGMYVCGPTVYGPMHLGHARTWIFFDWLRRYLMAQEYNVNFIQNITDVGHLTDDGDEGEDKLEKQARLENKTPREIAEFYEREYLADLAALDILTPDKTPRATEYIQDIIQYIEVLLKKGNAYVIGGNVYFDIASFPDYGKLSGRNVDEMISGARVKVDVKKKSPADFALWLASDENHLQKWPSPWGEGYPGWHIECSVMAPKYLGQPFDLHGGGLDNKFPHHENEIAQSEAFAGKPLANYWLHAGTLLVNGQKMAKSAKNYITIKDALKKVDKDTIKIAFMGTHWKKPFDWNDKVVSEAEKIRERLVRAYSEAQSVKTGYQKLIREALEDDFNVPVALAVIMEHIGELSLEDFEYIKQLFGLELQEKEKLTSEQEKMVQDREEARKTGNFTKSDEIRLKLEKDGIILEDTPSGTRAIWRKKT